ncbi:MAG: SRPBCC family protein [Acidimicrobiia bacterium]
MKPDSFSAHVNAPPATVLMQISDIARLPEWNRAITEVLESPAPLVSGAVWKVRLHALGQTWVSTSTLTELDEASGRLRYRSQTDDGNPSYADWDWSVASDGDGSQVTVTVTLHPITFWRKHVLAKLRRPALRREVRASLSALAVTHVDSGTSAR